MRSAPHLLPARRATTFVRRGVAALLVVGAGVVVAPGLDAPVAEAAGCGPAPQGQVAVVMVIDRGSGSPSTRCAVVPQGATGLDALRAAGHDVRLDGGFVCGIDGLPATGCGNRPDAGFAYWRYWHAAPGGAWSYSQVGAGGYRLPARCAVEGWVWSDSPSSNTPPSVPAPTPTCEAPPSTVAPTTPPGPAPTVPTAPAAPGGGAAPTSPPAAAAPGSGGAVTTVPGVPPASVAGETTVPTDPALAEVPSVEGAGASEGDASSADPDGDDGRSSAGDAAEGEAEGELAASAEGASSSGAPWGVAVAVVLVAALGGAAAWRSRRRSVDTPA